jgi:hypothetical protein
LPDYSVHIFIIGIQMKKLLIISTVVFAAFAHADDSSDKPSSSSSPVSSSSSSNSLGLGVGIGIGIGLGQGGNASTGPIENSNGQTQSATGGAGGSGGSGGSASQSTANANNASQQTTIQYTPSRIPAATAYAPAIHPTAVCALSLSGGAQGALFGLSLGGSYIDDNCRLLEQIRAAKAIGAEDVAVEMMMDIPSFAKAAQRIAERKK